MGKKITILILTIFVSVSTVFSQTIKKEEGIKIQKTDSTKAGEQLIPESQTIDPKLPEAINKGINKEAAIDEKQTQSSGLTPSTPSQGISPYFFDYPELLKRNPTLTDFYIFQQNHIYKQFFLTGSWEKQTYAGLGEYFAFNGAIRWNPSPIFFIEAGGMLSKQIYSVLPISKQDIAGVNARIQYNLTDKIGLNVWGQYLLFGTPPPPAYFPLFPHTGVGANISVDVKKNTDVSVGAEYRYDNTSQKWSVAPVGRISFGF